MPKFKKLRKVFSKLKLKSNKSIVNILQEDTSTQHKNESLYDASCRGDTAAVQHILSKHGADQESSTSLRAASGNGHADVVLLLLQHGVDANITDSHGRSALHRAVHNGHGKIVRFLVEHGADPFLGSPSPMKLAEEMWNKNPLALFRELVLEYYPERLGEQPGSPTKSADLGHVNRGKGPQSNKPNKKEETSTQQHKAQPLYEASCRGDTTAVQHIRSKHGADHESSLGRSKRNTTRGLQTSEKIQRLLLAAKAGQVKELKELLDDGIDVNSRHRESGCTALFEAAQGGQMLAAQLLLERGADTSLGSKSGKLPLHVTVQAGYLDLANILLEKGAEIEKRTWTESTALHLAAECGRMSMLNLLLMKRADPNAKDGSGKTALHIAIKNGHETLISLLLEKGADVNALDRNKQTLLHSAALDGSNTAILKLLERNVDIDAMDNDGWTALHFAALTGQAETARLLLKAGAKASLSNNHGDTPLHLAGLNRHSQVFRILLDNHASREARNRSGRTPSQMAGITERKAPIQGRKQIHSTKSNVLNELPQSGGQELSMGYFLRRYDQTQNPADLAMASAMRMN